MAGEPGSAPEGERALRSLALYQPFAELDFGKWPEGRPEDGYSRALTDQLTAVKRELEGLDPNGERHRIIRSSADLQAARESGQTAFMHCVEGGFQLGEAEAT